MIMTLPAGHLDATARCDECLFATANHGSCRGRLDGRPCGGFERAGGGDFYAGPLGEPWEPAAAVRPADRFDPATGDLVPTGGPEGPDRPQCPEWPPPPRDGGGDRDAVRDALRLLHDLRIA